MKKGIKQSEEYLRIVYFSNSLNFRSVLCVRVRAIFFHFRLKLKENNVLRQNLPRKRSIDFQIDAPISCKKPYDSQCTFIDEGQNSAYIHIKKTFAD